MSDPVSVTATDQHKNRAGKAAAVLLLGVAAFQLALALGAPWGVAAWGGTHHGTVPGQLRAVSAVASIGYVFLALIAGGVLVRGRACRLVLRTLSVLMGLGTLLNAASPSWVETLIWVPVTTILCVLLWRASGRNPR